jgi:hypothetical protein
MKKNENFILKITPIKRRTKKINLDTFFIFYFVFLKIKNKKGKSWTKKLGLYHPSHIYRVYKYIYIYIYIYIFFSVLKAFLLLFWTTIK